MHAGARTTVFHIRDAQMSDNNKKEPQKIKAVVRQVVQKTVFPPETTTSNGPPGTTFSVRIKNINIIKEEGE